MIKTIKVEGLLLCFNKYKYICVYILQQEDGSGICIILYGIHDLVYDTKDKI